ncbi:MAG: amidohydrolase family protein [Acidimicrobiales bacterium]
MTWSIRATVLQTPTPDALETLEDQIMVIDDRGKIASIEPADTDAVADVTLPSTTVLLPGLIDTHLHAPQWPQLGTGLDLPLERWLFERTFPLEARFADTAWASTVWNDMVPRLLAGGTTTAVYYGSTHEAATLALATACHAHGQRALVGRVAMDHTDGTPDWYRDESATESVNASFRSVEAIHALGGRSGLVQPIITPRFIPACSDAALHGLGELAEATGTMVQTHVSESTWEHQYVIDRFGESDTEALVRLGLARNHSVLAHGVHLSTADTARLVEVGAGVAHCPLSNSYFGNGVFPARRSLSAGLRLGLGTDVAGGPEPSLLRQCSHAVTSSRMREDAGHPESRIDAVTAFWLATTSGADLLGIDAGVLAPGRAFDAIAVDLTSAELGHWPDLDDWETAFEKIVRRGSERSISQVWVDGVDVTPSP